MKNQIFDVDVKGLRQLQLLKPKWFIIRELLQNALDEEIKKCNVYMSYAYGKASITVEDDSPIGFRDLADSYTLFKDTYKRTDVKKRGRYNFGEKQVICLSDYARIITTTGGLEFDILKGTRSIIRKKRQVGSEVYVIVKMSRIEYNECIAYLKTIKPSKDIEITININDIDAILDYIEPYKVISAKLQTEIKEDNAMRLVQRDTNIFLYKENNPCLYELGIPVCDIDCEYSVDVQQKIPLSNDRDKVNSKYLKDIFAIVLNNVIDDIKEDDISQVWIREAITSDKIEGNTVMDIKVKRFGDLAVISNPFDPNANDEAVSKGYKVITGSEMSKEEWTKMKQHGNLVSSTALFGKTPKEVDYLDWDKHHYPLIRLAKKIAKDYSNYDLTVQIYRDGQISARASFGSNTLSFNLAHLTKEMFLPDAEGYINEEMLDLLIHEFGHKDGCNHTEHRYHEYLTGIGAWLVKKAILDKDYFKLI